MPDFAPSWSVVQLLLMLTALALLVVGAWHTFQPPGHDLRDEPDDPGDPGEPVDVEAPLHAWWSRRVEVPRALRAGAGLLLGALAAGLALLVPALALAQSVDAGPPPDPAGLDPAAQSALMTLGAQLVAAIVAAGPGGALAAIAAGAQLLVSATKAPAFEALFATRSWLRPLVSVLGGLALAVVGAVATGQPILPALIVGPMAGTIAIGVRELSVALLGTKTRDERAAGKAAADAVKGTDAEIAAKVSAFKAQLDAAAALPDEAARLKALADLWKSKGVPPAVSPGVSP